MYILLGERKLSKKTPVFDHADQLLYQADQAKAQELLRRQDIDIIGNATRIRAIRFRGPDVSGLRSGSRVRRQLGQPHRSENYWNCKGCWHIDRIPEVYGPLFRGVLLDCVVV
jgi:hypothetical protein